MKPDAIVGPKRMTFQDVEWGPDDKPVLIADGRVYRIDDLDEPLEPKAAYVVRVVQKSFEKLCRFLRPGILHFYEMRVGDISPLAGLHSLQQLAIRWNTKLADISPLSYPRELKILVLENTPKVVDLIPIADCVALRALEYSGGIWNKNSAASLTPLANLPVLEDLILTNLRVQADGLKPLAGCKRLKRLEVSNQFETEDYAFLSVALPDLECSMLAPYVRLNQAIDGKDIMVVGSRKPFLNSRDDLVRIKMYEEDFCKLKARFVSNKSSNRTQTSHPG